VLIHRASSKIGKKRERLMDRVPSGKQRRDAVSPSTAKVEAAGTTKWSASREEAAILRQRLLKMIVDNEERRRNTAVTNQA
jgi:hypothetical protein